MSRRCSPFTSHVAAPADSGTAGAQGHRKNGSGGRFIVEKHDARQIHFDFRLEVDGIVKSWAVTHGPSLDPADRRLAVRTDDHPASNHVGDTAPDALPWDTGEWLARGDALEHIDKGVLEFDLNGTRLQGGFVLMRLGKKSRERRENWLLVKQRDAFAEHQGPVADRLPNGVATSGLTDTSAPESEPGRTVKATRRGRRVGQRAHPKHVGDDDDGSRL